MGCWDVFCLLCGNSCHAVDADDSVKFFENELEYNEKMEKAYNTNKNIVDKLEQFIKNIQWVEECTFLTLDNRVIHGCEEISCGNDFRDKKGNNYRHAPWEYKHGKIDITVDSGIFVHTDCWKYIKQKHKIDLTFSYLPFVDNKIKLNDNLYNPIYLYQEQNFNYVGAFIDGNGDYCLSPLVKPTIINKVFANLKIKKSDTRKSPATSATLYVTGMYKVGNNGNIWMIQKGKWGECKDTVEKELVMNINKIQKYKYIGESNKVPVFIKSKEIKGTNVIIKFVTLTSYINELH
jgi:hypothetical protein